MVDVTVDEKNAVFWDEEKTTPVQCSRIERQCTALCPCFVECDKHGDVVFLCGCVPVRYGLKNSSDPFSASYGLVSIGGTDEEEQ